MIRLLYNLLFPLGLLFFLPAYLLKMRRRGNYRRNFGQRFGFYSADVHARLAGRSSTWIHAVSVGEVTVALKLAAKLRELDSAFECVVTTTTTTGFAVATAGAAEWMEVMYNPLDFLPVVRRAYALIRPVRIVLIEAEVWPNLAAEARRRRVPIALVNARLSPRSERRFRRFRAFVAPTFGCLDLVCVQEQSDVARWESLGVKRQRIETVGSIKFDPEDSSIDGTEPFQILEALGIARESPILFGGSTHPGEEEILGEIAQRLRAEFPSLVLIIAPRHVERVAAVQDALERKGLHVVRCSVKAPLSRVPDCLLLDTTGELRSWYTVATVVFVGKSLATKGGQNPVEPIMAGKAVIFGPHMENFAPLAKSLRTNAAAVQVENAEELERAATDLLRNPDRRARLVENARAVLARHSGATERTARLLVPLRSHTTAP